ncbi:MAG: hypothetical protein PW734_00965 [Verrucomicrobium sp.]|nr:hypothetical protein [Verrucomicrobium sp.]
MKKWLLCAALLGLLPSAGWAYSTIYWYIPSFTGWSPSSNSLPSNPAVQGKSVYIGSSQIYFNTQNNSGMPVSYYQADYARYIGYGSAGGVGITTSEAHGSSNVPYGTCVTTNVDSGWFGSHGFPGFGNRQITSNGMLVYTMTTLYSSTSGSFNTTWETHPTVVPAAWVDLNDLTKNSADAPLPLGNLAVQPAEHDNLAVTWRLQ